MKASRVALLLVSLFVIQVSTALFLAGCTSSRPSPPLNLATEYRHNPLGIDRIKPRFFWEISMARRGTFQSAYQILVATDSVLLTEDKADQWNSGKVISNQNIQVPYAGSPLESGTEYYWRVRFWDENNTPSSYSAPARFETGLLDQADWKASWIYSGVDAPENEADLYGDIPAPLFRKSFRVSRPVKAARLYISGLGYCEAYLNGGKIGKDLLNPGWTNYNKRVQYNTYDVTQMLMSGENVLGAILGNGWYNPLPLALFNRLNLRTILHIGQPKLIAQLRIIYPDGSDTLIVSDESWVTGDSPILRNNVYLGEKYDARREQDGWSSPGFDASRWKKSAAAEPPGGRLVAQIQPPVRVTREVTPIAITEPQPGVFILDMGQNFAGCARLRVSGPNGTMVQMRYGELLNDDGTLNDRSTMACHIYEGSYVKPRPGAPKNADQRDIYILKGDGEEVYSSRFTFHGFRYVEVTGYPGRPALDAITGLRMNSDLQQAGTLETSNRLLNQIQENVLWTFLSNVFSIESDCPGREKFGYGGDIVTAGEAFMLNFNMADFYTKAVRDFQDEQRSSGGMTECAPDNGVYDEGLTADTGPIGWMIVHPFLVDNLLRYYGDRSMLEEQYESARRLNDFIAGHAEDGIISAGIGDHGTIADKDLPVSGTGFYYYTAKAVSDFARVLGRRLDQQKYAMRADSIQTRFVDEFLNNATGAVGMGTQADQAVALYYNLVPQDLREKALQHLTQDIANRNHHVTTGIFGTKFLWNVLHETRNDLLAWRINTQESAPSYGFMLASGATTIWEHWEGRGSHNHPMFGSISEWMYKALGGITPATDAVGFDHIMMRPAVVDTLRWVKASYQSVRGLISCSWKRVDGQIEMRVVIPGNTLADLYISQTERSKIEEDGKAVKTGHGITSIMKTGDDTVLRLGAGDYAFVYSQD